MGLGRRRKGELFNGTVLILQDEKVLKIYFTIAKYA
jgi:hypothetical protein